MEDFTAVRRLAQIVTVTLLIFLSTKSALADFGERSEPTLRSPSVGRVAADLRAILAAGDLDESLITISRSSTTQTSSSNSVEILCEGGRIHLSVSAKDEEWSSTFYYGLQKLGFLFPHPRWQITPSIDQMNKQCGVKLDWQPRFRFRGFHMHTMHPSEWLHGFLMGDKKIARDMINWSVRNSQNTLQLVLLRQDRDQLKANLGDISREAQDAGLTFGIDVSFTLAQQKAYRLVGRDSILSPIFESRKQKAADVKANIEDLAQTLSFDYLTLEIGSSEFTSANYDETLNWLNIASQTALSLGKVVFAKVHTSVNQSNNKYGNFNFLPQFADSSVGILPHTVMFYDLLDTNAPVYQRQDFHDMKDFMLAQNPKRATWYFPETSYFIGIDIDIPLLLTDYLLSRSRDMDLAESSGVTGHLDFTTGQEIGYWLLDWTVALLANTEYRSDPYIGLRLLGENIETWQKIVDFQHQYFKEHGLLEELSSENLMDEIPFFQNHVLARTNLAQLRKQPTLLAARIAVLDQATLALPDVSSVKNAELRDLIGVTNLRVQFALDIRKAIRDRNNKPERALDLTSAQTARLNAKSLIDHLIATTNRYPEAQIFEENENLSSYPFGYGWTVRNLHFWEREERMVRENNFSPLFMNIYDPTRLLL